MTLDNLLTAVEQGRQITLDEYDRIVRRHTKIELELHRIGNVLAELQEPDGKPKAGRVTVKRLPKAMDEREQSNG